MTNNSKYIEEWYLDLNQRSTLRIERDLQAHGVCNRIAGPRQMYAEVTISLHPGRSFDVKDKMDREKASRIHEYGYYKSIVFGVLDILLTHAQLPITECYLEIHDVEINEVHSSPMAFRLAARDAAVRILEKAGVALTSNS